MARKTVGRRKVPFELPQALEWKSFLKHHTSKRWLSQSVKRGLMAEYARSFDGSPIWGHERMDEVEKRVPDAIELSAGTSRKARKPQAHLLEAAKKAIDDGYTDFASIKGYKDFRDAIAHKLSDENEVEYDPDTEISPTTGCQQAIDGTFRILVDPGDEVLLIDPEYASFELPLRWYGAKVIPVPLSKKDGNWSFNPSELSKRVTRRTKLLVMSNPNNLRISYSVGMDWITEGLSRLKDAVEKLPLPS